MYDSRIITVCDTTLRKVVCIEYDRGEKGSNIWKLPNSIGNLIYSLRLRTIYVRKLCPKLKKKKKNKKKIKKKDGEWSVGNGVKEWYSLEK